MLLTAIVIIPTLSRNIGFRRNGGDLCMDKNVTKATTCLSKYQKNTISVLCNVLKIIVFFVVVDHQIVCH